jgi:hypothetical protein
MRPTSWISGLVVVASFSCNSSLDVHGDGDAASVEGGAGGAPPAAAGAHDPGVAGAPQVIPGSQGAPCIGAAGAGPDSSKNAEEPPYCNGELVCGTNGICGTIGPCEDVDGQIPCILYEGKTGTDISDFAIDAKNLYWVEYGGFDELDNYATPGVLKSAPLRGGPVKVVAKNLPGPIQVVVTEKGAFFRLDQLVGSKAEILSAIARMTTPGNELEILMTDTKRTRFDCLTSSHDTAYWVERDFSDALADDIYAGTDAGEPSLIATGKRVSGLGVTETDVFWTGDTGLWRVAREGGDKKQLAKSSPGSFPQVWGEYLYVCDGTEVSRLAMDGSGAWQRVYRGPENWWTNAFTIMDDRYILFEVGPYESEARLLASPIEPPAEPRVFGVPRYGGKHPFISEFGPDGAYWLEGTRIHFAPFSAFRSTASLTEDVSPDE